MNRIIKIIIIFLTINLYGCGYKPIFISSDFKFSIGSINSEGNGDVNSIIINQIRSIKKDKTIKYNINLSTTLNKKILSKDKSGDPSKFEMMIVTTFEVINEKNNRILLRDVSRKINYDNKTDNFELDNYEQLVIENLAKTISEEIFSLLANLNSE